MALGWRRRAGGATAVCHRVGGWANTPRVEISRTQLHHELHVQLEFCGGMGPHEQSPSTELGFVVAVDTDGMRYRFVCATLSTCIFYLCIFAL